MFRNRCKLLYRCTFKDFQEKKNLCVFKFRKAQKRSCLITFSAWTQLKYISYLFETHIILKQTEAVKNIYEQFGPYNFAQHWPFSRGLTKYISRWLLIHAGAVEDPCCSHGCLWLHWVLREAMKDKQIHSWSRWGNQTWWTRPDGGFTESGRQSIPNKVTRRETEITAHV